MHQEFTVSRRKVVTLVAGSLAASAAPAAARVAVSARAAGADSADAATLLSESHRQLLQLLKAVRCAPGTATRAEAFRRFAAALRRHDGIEVSVGASAPVGRKTPRAGGLTALYRQRAPAAVLANVIVRELEARPQSDAAWMTRFTELEALIG